MAIARRYGAVVTQRCFGTGDPLYEQYHDTEWGIPVHDENALFEKLCLEAFQSGLSWITILRKRDGFRRAFHGFVPESVAAFADSDVERLMADASIVRNRRKIDAAITNARAILQLHSEGRTLAELMWSTHDQTRARPASFAELPAHTPESKDLAKTLKKAGFGFVGPTTVYAAMQACGIVNDHIQGCPAGDQLG